MAELAPGSGGAKMQKSFNELTVKTTTERLNDLFFFSLFRFGLALTVGILTLRGLVGAGSALVCSFLSVFRLWGKTRRAVGGRVGLRVDADETEVENEWEDGGEHRGSREKEEGRVRKGRKETRGFKGGPPRIIKGFLTSAIRLDM